MKIAVDLISGFAAGAPASAQNFNYLPGRVKTYNNSQVGKPTEPGELERCRFDMLPRREQRRLNEQALAKV